MNDLFLDRKYIQRLTGRLEQLARVHGDLFSCRCPICGDSKKSLHKKRFYFYVRKGSYKVRCHNCGYSESFYTFLEQYAGDLFQDYILDRYKHVPLRHAPTAHLKDIVEKTSAEGFSYTSLTKFEDLSPKHPARRYVEKRKIPLDLVHYCSLFSNYVQETNNEHYIEAFENCKEPRMIIPFYDRDGVSRVYQARSFDPKSNLKYITIKETEETPKIWGMNKITIHRPVRILEGPIDAMFVKNAIAMSGITNALPSNVKEAVYIYDNEPRNKDVVKAMLMRVKQGHAVMVWPMNIKRKDINDLIVKDKWNSVDIERMIEYNTFRGIESELIISKWRK